MGFPKEGAVGNECVGKGSPEMDFIPAAAMESRVKIGMEGNQVERRKCGLIVALK